MCGLAGVAGPVEPDPLRQALAALAHRGPDDSGIFADRSQGIGLVHARLSILDLSPSGHQPMASADGRVVLVFNGEIYNFRELRAELEVAGRRFNGHSDTEVLLNLYLHQRAEGGDVAAMLRRLNGIFAFALWDADRGALLLARDALGVKPLYYSAGDGRVAFASEIKALLPLAAPFGELDAASIDRYLSFLWCPGEGTPVRSVRKLGPGEALWVRDGCIAERLSWYRLPAFRPVAAVSGAAAVRETEARLRTAVHRQMVADVPVGAFLSGGLDSSSIVAFARETNPDLRCFTIEAVGAAGDGMADDLPYARRVAAHFKVPLDVVRVDAARMAQDLDAMVAQLDEPLADPAPLNVLYICRRAREQGMKVLLSGAGGDDLFTGYRRHRAVQAERFWAWLPRTARAGLARLAGGFDQRRALGRRVRKLLSGAALSSDERLVNYFRWTGRQDLAALYAPEFRAAIADAEATAPMTEFLSGLPGDLPPLGRMLVLEQRFFLADHNLIYTDKMSMAAGVEVRVPFLDLDLVEFAQTIPLGLKQRGAEGKWILKKAMERYLPHDVIYRPKTGFGVPLRAWMRHDLRGLLADVLCEGNLRRRGIFSPCGVQDLIRKNDSGEIDGSYTLLSILCIELWCRKFLDIEVRKTCASTTI